MEPIPTEPPRPPPPPPPPPPRQGWLARLRGAPATTGLLATLALVFLAQSLWPDVDALLAKDSRLVRSGELWRLVTANFLHANLVHLLVNAWALFAIGPTVERLYGRVVFLATFVVGGAAGFAASTAFTAAPSVGASAGLFALLGVLLGFALRARDRLVPAARSGLIREILLIAGLNLALGVTIPRIDNAAHLGGFAAGIALGLALRAPAPPRRA